MIGKKAFTREEYEELRGIPSITDKEPRKSPIINRYELSDDEVNNSVPNWSIFDASFIQFIVQISGKLKHNYIFQQNDIKNLPDIVDSQYAIGRGIHSEEEVREIKALPDMLVISNFLFLNFCEQWNIKIDLYVAYRLILQTLNSKKFLATDNFSMNTNIVRANNFLSVIHILYSIQNCQQHAIFTTFPAVRQVPVCYPHMSRPTCAVWSSYYFALFIENFWFLNHL